MLSWDIVIALTTALGVGTIVPKMFDKLMSSITERGHAKRADAERLAQLVDEAKQERDRAFSHFDVEAARRRRMEEHASQLRRMLTEAPCVDYNEIPPWPNGTGSTPQGGTK